MDRISRMLAGMTTAAIRVRRPAACAFPSERQEERRAHHDALTGLLNRAGLACEFRRWTTGDDRLALLYLDLDRFKAVNDSLGRMAGDALLKEVADRLRRVCRPGDSIARIRGDEFVILSAAADVASASAVGERILAAIGDEAFFLGKEVTVVSGSLGIAFSPDHGQAFGPLLGEADAALYEAKCSGRGRCVVARTGMQPVRRPFSVVQGGAICQAA